MRNILAALSLWCFSANSFAGGIVGGGGAISSENSQLMSLKLARSLYQELRTVVEEDGIANLQINKSTTITVKSVDGKMVDESETVIIEPAE